MLGRFFQKPTKKDYFIVRSFTYFIPSPPARHTGYREKEFDKIFEIIINSGFDVIKSNMEHCSFDKGGMWVHYLLGATTKEAASMDLDNIETRDPNYQPPKDLEIEYLDE